MLRVSDCQYLVAIVYESAIEIQKTDTFLEFNLENPQVNNQKIWHLKKNFKEKELEAKSTLAEGVRYSYLEWPPLNYSYIKSKESFLKLFNFSQRTLFLDTG